MPVLRELRRARSARHYLIDGPLMGRLEMTLALISRSMGFPVIRVNIVDQDSQQSVSLFGAEPGDAIPRAEAVCDTVVRSGRPLQVQDAAADPRFNLFPGVVNGEIGAYLGVPLMGRESLVVGTVCVIDPFRRTLDAGQQARLVEFGRIVEDQLDLIRRLKEQRLEGLTATTDLVRAIRDGEIVPWYQPVVDLATGETVAFEALARWEHPCGLVEDPRRFIPMAEDSDVIIELDLAVIRQALVDLSRWHRTTPSLRIGVNLSARHFDHHDCVSKLLAAAVDAGVSPAAVDLEVTETAVPATGYGEVAGMVQQLRDHGFGVWLDDFGTGWSSLDNLLWLRVDGIKIDRAVTVALGTPIGDALTRAATGLAKALGLRTTIEGIETRRSMDLARARGCDYGQGYLWARPEPAARIDDIRATRPGTRDGAGQSPPAPAHTGPAWATEDMLAAAVLDALPDATAVLDQTGAIIAVNHAWRMFALDNGGTETDTGVGVNYLDVCIRSAAAGSADAAQVVAHLHDVLAGRSIEADLEYPCPSPAVGRWFLLRLTRLTGLTTGVVASHVNITRRKMAENELAHAASHDPLSGLVNRTLLIARLEAALTPRALQHRSADVGVLYIDLDGFKAVNDTYGHSAGDEVLLTVARRLRNLVRPADTIARLGGDEFTVLAPRTDATGLAGLADRIERSLAEPHRIHGDTVIIGGSIGTYLARAGEHAADALHHADQAMYSNKRARHRTNGKHLVTVVDHAGTD